MRSIVLATWVLLLGQLPLADASLTKEQFLAQYEPAAKKLRDFYSAVTMSGMYRQTWVSKRDPSKETKFSDRFTLYANGDWLRLDTVRVEGLRPGKPETTISVVGPEKSLSLSRNSTAHSLVLQALEPRSPAAGHSIRLLFYGIFAPYRDTDGVTIVERLSDNATTILEIQEKHQSGEDLVTVSARFRRTGVPVIDANKPPPEALGSYTFSKNKGWAVIESEWGPVDSDEFHVSANVEYGDTVDGVPLLKKVIHWGQTRTNRVKSVECDIAELTIGAVPRREFTLAAFGLRDIGEEAETRYWLYLIVAGVVLIAAAIVLSRLLAARRMRT